MKSAIFFVFAIFCAQNVSAEMCTALAWKDSNGSITKPETKRWVTTKVMCNGVVVETNNVENTSDSLAELQKVVGRLQRTHRLVNCETVANICTLSKD